MEVDYAVAIRPRRAVVLRLARHTPFPLIRALKRPWRFGTSLPPPTVAPLVPDWAPITAAAHAAGDVTVDPQQAATLAATAVIETLEEEL